MRALVPNQARELPPKRASRWNASRLWPESGAVSPIPALDGLRAIAVVLVMLFHAWYQLPGFTKPGLQPYQYAIYFGRTGVHLFFVLSGFLLFLPYARWILGVQARPSTKLFFRRRALRVGPAYWVSLAILSLSASLTIATLFDVGIHTLFLSNVTSRTVFSIDGVFWTMAIEVQFYLTLPLIAMFLFRLSRAIGWFRALVALDLLFCAVSAASMELERTHRLGKTPFVSTFLLGETSLTAWLAVFVGGITCSLLYVYLTQGKGVGRLNDARMMVGTCAVVCGVLAALGLAFIPISQLVIKHLGFGWAYTLILFGLLFGAPMLRRPFEWRVVRFVGLISYSLYIWHNLIFAKVESRLPAMPFVAHVATRFVVGGLLAIGVAYVSYQFVERPFIPARKKAHDPIETSQAVSSPTMGSAVLARVTTRTHAQ